MERLRSETTIRLYPTLLIMGKDSVSGRGRGANWGYGSHPFAGLSITDFLERCPGILERAVQVPFRVARAQEKGFELGRRKVVTAAQHSVEETTVTFCIRAQ